MENLKNLKAVDDKEFLISRQKEVINYIESQIKPSGYMKASHNYLYYIPMWFRDSSFTSISLTHNAKFFEKNNDKEDEEKAKDASTRLLNFMWKSVNNFSQNMEKAINLPYEHPAFNNTMLTHVPARINEDGKMGWHRGNNLMESDDPVDHLDFNQSLWLKQFDSVPLLIIATNEYIKNFGIDEKIGESLHKITKLLPLMINYMNKIYVTPCSNAWEMDTNQIHAYDVAAIYSGMENALELVKYFKKELNEEYSIKKLKKLKDILNASDIENCLEEKNKAEIELCLKAINMANNEKINNIDENEILKNMDNIDKFLKNHFIRNNILYKAKDVFKNDGTFKNGPVFEVDSEEIFIFTRFKPPSATKTVQNKTMEKIETDLFDGNVLPIRFLGDKYFFGGRWPLLGLEAANWYIQNNKKENAEKIINYITEKYLLNSNKIPEQELVNPASKDDPDKFFEKNNSNIIDDLAWSESAYADVLSEYLKSLNLEQDEQENKKKHDLKIYKRES